MQTSLGQTTGHNTHPCILVLGHHASMSNSTSLAED